MIDCIFCKIIAGEIPSEKIYEDSEVISILDINPNNPGHALVIPKKHSPNLLEASDEILKPILPAVKKIAPAILRTVEAPAFNLIVNNGEEASQVIHHLHFHIVPRFAEDNVISAKHTSYEEGEIQQIGEKIRERLQ